MKKYFTAMMVSFFVFFTGYFLFATMPCQAATYYIDYVSGSDTNSGLSKSIPWKRCPGMKGFAGRYAHQAGDVFIFKGGVTWDYRALPLTIANSGAAGSADQYTVDKTWYVGSAWSYPVFDGGAQLQMSGFTSSNKSNLVINGFKIYNTGYPADGSGYGITTIGGSNVEISNCWFETYAVNAWGYVSGTATTERKIYFHDNHLRRNGRVHVLISSGKTVDDMQLYNNAFEGPTGYDPHAYHCDGFMIGGYGPGNSVTNLKIYGNLFFGDWSKGATAQVYLNGYVNGAQIYNNIFAFENKNAGTSLSPAFLFIYGYNKNIGIYNNTFSNDASPGVAYGTQTCISMARMNDRINIRNNIFSKTRNGVIYSDTTNVTMDYNLHNEYSGGRLIWNSTGAWACQTIAACRSRGFEVHSPSPGPAQFAALPSGGVTGTGDWHLLAVSPAINTGADLSGIFNTDKDGNARPQSLVWDIGAYEYNGSTAGTGTSAPPPSASLSAPAAPSSMTATAGSKSLIALAWKDNSANEDGFKVERCTNALCSTATLIAVVPTNTTVYNDSGLATGKYYYYRVRAYNAAGNSGYSNLSYAKTLK